MSGTITAESMLQDYLAEVLPKVTWHRFVGENICSTPGRWMRHVWDFEEAASCYGESQFLEIRPGVWKESNSWYEFCFLPAGVNPSDQ